MMKTKTSIHPSGTRRKITSLFAILVGAALMFPALTFAGPRRVILVRRPAPRHKVVLVRPAPVRKVVLVNRPVLKPLKKVWISGHWARTPFGCPVWVPGHYQHIR